MIKVTNEVLTEALLGASRELSNVPGSDDCDGCIITNHSECNDVKDESLCSTSIFRKLIEIAKENVKTKNSVL